MSFFEDVFSSGQSFFKFVLAVVIILIMLDGLVTQFNASNVATDESKSAVTSVKNQAYTYLDVGFLVLAIGLIIVAVLIGLLKSQDPVWFVGTIIGLVAVMFILVIIGAMYDRLINVSSVSLVISQLTYIPFIMAHLLEYAILFATATSISIYSGKRGT